MAGSEPAQKVRLSKSNEADERRLVEAAQRDVSRFAELYEKYFGVVYAYVARRVRDREATEDLTSEVFRKALASLPRFKLTGAPFAAWLLRIASNMIADRVKRAARDIKVTAYQSEPPHAVGSVPRSANRVRSQQSELEAAERRATLFRLVDELAEEQRRVIGLRFAEEKSIRDIASEMGRSEGAVKQLQFRALKNLRSKLVSDE